MHIQKKSRRVRVAIVGTLLASVMSVGVMTNTASAAKPAVEATVTVDDSGVQVRGGIPPMTMQSGIRW